MQDKTLEVTEQENKVSIQQYIEDITEWAVDFAPKVIAAGLILFIGFKVVKKLHSILSSTIEKSNIDPEISGFIISIIEIALKAVVVLSAVAVLGVKLTALFGILAAAGFAVGMALQGFLGNFASGLTIVFLKPYKVGDWVQISDSFGRVKSIQIFNTILTTPGNKTLVIPNGKVTDDIITNFSTEGFMRLEISVLMAYEESYPRIEQIIREALSETEYVLNDPKALIGIESYDTHNIVVTVRPFIKADDYWDATFAVNQSIKKALSKNGVQMAYSEGVELGPIGE